MNKIIKSLITFLIIISINILIYSEKFSFVVIGDTRPPLGTKDFSNFNKLIKKFNDYKPDFVINVGDLIIGYGSPDDAKIWKEYTNIVSGIKYKYYQIPGNHDIFSKKGEALYKNIFDKMYYSFDFKDYHFIMLDSSESSIWGYISTKQLDWLKNDLLQNKNKNTFIFLHFPLWDRTKSRTQKKYNEFWFKEIMPLIKAYKVKAVFAGHMHCYGPTQTIDGINYFITGGGGAELNRWYKDFGGTHHFMIVKVNDNNYDCKIVTEESEYTDEQADVSKNHIFEEKYTTHAKIDYENIAKDLQGNYQIKIHNPYPYDLTGDANWDYDKSLFKIKPEYLSIHIKSKETIDYNFGIKALNKNIDVLKYPKIKFKLNNNLVFTKDLIFKKHFLIAHTNREFILDGNLNEWYGFKPISLCDNKNNIAADYYFSYNEKYLLIGVKINNKILKEDNEDFLFNDAVIISLDKTNQELSNENNDMQLEFSQLNKQKIVYDRISGEEISIDKSGILYNITQSDNDIIYEIALPQSILNPFILNKGNEFGFNIALVYIDKDNKRQMISLTPGIGFISIDESFESQSHFASGKLN